MSWTEHKQAWTSGQGSFQRKEGSLQARPKK